ncbi:DUF3040 domain-containing protein [Nonomuraea endophytica]|uniref:Putative heme iron utilization protein n=1 Tax=Nonomuraea endophytica TaxID=714136 RepID=A0A7W8A023_9ACTN|nr:DUF3040 domain-containing protein [Nonomuraea endophytica]MBB5077023.1 putative heme iron utilization protein [Nonomuraea endophytica]
MALSAREQTVLDAIARQLAVEDPALVKDLSEHGSGVVTAERIPQAWDAWPVALIALCLAVFTVVLLLSGSPSDLPHAVIR